MKLLKEKLPSSHENSEKKGRLAIFIQALECTVTGLVEVHRIKCSLMYKFESRVDNHIPAKFRQNPDHSAPPSAFFVRNTLPLSCKKDRNIMFVVAVVLFVAGSIIAVFNAYYCGKCFAVGQPKEYAHFSPCTFF